MAGRTRREAEALRTAFTEKAILDAAERTFARRGLRGARVREIAAAAGLQPGTLYNYFAGKEALYEAVLERGIRPLRRWLAEFAEGPPSPERARRVVREVMAHLAERPYLARLVYLEAIEDGPRLRRVARRSFRPLGERILTELRAWGQETGESRGGFPARAALFFHLSFGHFVLAPLLREIFPGSPTAPEGVAAQTRLIETLIERLFEAEARGDGRGDETARCGSKGGGTT